MQKAKPKNQSLKILIALLAAISTTLFANSVRAEIFSLTPANSKIGFNVSYLLVGRISGEFDDFSGSFFIDALSPDNSHVRATIQTNSVDTGSSLINQDIRSPDLFNVQTYPTMTFQSDKVHANADNNFAQISGKLTLLGITKAITLELVIASQKDKTLGNAFKATGQLKRSDFGMRTSKPIGDMVDLIICYNTTDCDLGRSDYKQTRPRYNH